MKINTASLEAVRLWQREFGTCRSAVCASTSILGAALSEFSVTRLIHQVDPGSLEFLYLDLADIRGGKMREAAT